MQHHNEHHDPHHEGRDMHHEPHHEPHGPRDRFRQGRSEERAQHRGPGGRMRDRGSRREQGFAPGFGPGGPTGPRGDVGQRHAFGPHGGPRPRPGFGPEDPFGPDGAEDAVGLEDPFDGGRGRRAHRGRRGGRPGGPRGTGRARRGDVRLALLGLLAEEPMNGYQLIKTLEERTDGRWRPSPGAVYPALAQLQDEGLVEPADGDGKVFRLTESGRTEATQPGDRARPWEAMTADQPDPETGPAVELRDAVGKLGVAARAAAQSGDDAVVRAVARLLDESRRGIYRLLADGAGGSAAEDEDDRV